MLVEGAVNSTFWTSSQLTAEITLVNLGLSANSQLTAEFTIAEFTIVNSGLSANSQLTAEFTAVNKL